MGEPDVVADFKVDDADRVAALLQGERAIFDLLPNLQRVPCAFRILQRGQRIVEPLRISTQLLRLLAQGVVLIEPGTHAGMRLLQLGIVADQ